MKFVVFGLSAIIGAANLYWGTQSSWLFQSGRINTTQKLSLKIIDLALKKETDPLIITKLTRMRKAFILYLIVFYTLVILAIFLVYLAANGKS